jgi:hypothetical protein
MIFSKLLGGPKKTDLRRAQVNARRRARVPVRRKHGAAI